MLTAEKKYFELREAEDVTVVTFIDRNIIEDQQIRDSGIQLLRLVNEENRTKILIDFSRVRFMSSTMFSELINLRKKIRERHGRLVFCGIVPGILYEVFSITGMNRFFDICETETDSLLLF